MSQPRATLFLRDQGQAKRRAPLFEHLPALGNRQIAKQHLAEVHGFIAHLRLQFVVARTLHQRLGHAQRRSRQRRQLDRLLECKCIDFSGGQQAVHEAHPLRFRERFGNRPVRTAKRRETGLHVRP